MGGGDRSNAAFMFEEWQRKVGEFPRHLRYESERALMLNFARPGFR